MSAEKKLPKWYWRGSFTRLADAQNYARHTPDSEIIMVRHGINFVQYIIVTPTLRKKSVLEAAADRRLQTFARK